MHDSSFGSRRDARALLAADRALRGAREAILGAGSLSDILWALLIELAPVERGLDFETLSHGIGSPLGRATLLRSLATLEGEGLIEAVGTGPAPLLAHVRVTAKGHKAIEAVLARAAAVLAGLGSGQAEVSCNAA